MNEEERRSLIQAAFQLQDSTEGIYQNQRYTVQRTPDQRIVVTFETGARGYGETVTEALGDALGK